jgi:hypothetical protein
MTTARSTQPHVLELDELLPAVVVVVVELEVVVVGRARVVVVVGAVVVVVGAVVGGTVVVVVGAAVVDVTGAVVVVVSWAAALPDRTPSMIGVALRAKTSAAERRKPFECMRAAYGQLPACIGDRGSRRARTSRKYGFRLGAGPAGRRWSWVSLCTAFPANPSLK